MLNISIISKMDHIKSKPSGPAKNSVSISLIVTKELRHEKQGMQRLKAPRADLSVPVDKN